MQSCYQKAHVSNCRICRAVTKKRTFPVCIVVAGKRTFAAAEYIELLPERACLQLQRQNCCWKVAVYNCKSAYNHVLQSGSAVQ